jgi:hypothetical protein
MMADAATARCAVLVKLRNAHILVLYEGRI